METKCFYIKWEDEKKDEVGNRKMEGNNNSEAASQENCLKVKRSP